MNVSLHCGVCFLYVFIFYLGNTTSEWHDFVLNNNFILNKVSAQSSTERVEFSYPCECFFGLFVQGNVFVEAGSCAPPAERQQPSVIIHS